MGLDYCSLVLNFEGTLVLVLFLFLKKIKLLEWM